MCIRDRIYYLENRVRPKILIAIGALMVGFSWLVLVGIGGYSLQLIYGVLLLSILLITFGEIINFPYVNVKVLGMADEESKGDYIGLYTMMWPLAMIAASPIGFNVADATMQMQYSIMNITGQEMLRGAYSANTGANLIHIDLKQLVNGMYLIQLVDLETREETTFKVVVSD